MIECADKITRRLIIAGDQDNAVPAPSADGDEI